MYEITVKGTAQTDYDFIPDLHGVDCGDEFTQYFGVDERPLMRKGVRNGYMEFRYEDGQLWTVTTYISNEELTAEELQILLDYTTGQWGDGIGEGFEQEACYFDSDGEEVYISPYHSEQEATIEQEEV